MTSERFRFDTRAIHASQEPDPTTGAVMPSIVLSSTFAHEAPGKRRAYEYSRTNNPTRETLERCLASLEGAEHGLAFASGVASMACVFQTLRPGDHVVASADIYGGTFRLLDKVFGPMGIQTTWVDMRDPTAVRGAMNARTKWVWAESPSNPTLAILDLPAIAEEAHRGGALFGVDNTFASPALQRPLELGADLVAHSTTKYLNGHSDVVGGALLVNDTELAQRLRFLQNAIGAVPSPFDCFLVLRGLKTLPVRMERHSKSALRLAEHLLSHPRVARVLYPGLPTHEGHAIAARQMDGFGGMLSFVVEGGSVAARSVMGATSIFALAESLGGVESLIEHPASMTHASMPPDVRERAGIVDGLLRLSVGLEDPRDLIDDLDRALATVRPEV